jgi:tetratricopeptide (TPR) repeat protein
MADQIGRAFEDVLRAWSARPSLVVVLEDLQWGDAASVKILDRALRKLEGSKLFVLALGRLDVHERFPVLFPNHDVTEVRLPPIPKRACAKLVREVMGESANVDDVLRIVERSEGNGFYLEELIRADAEHAGDQTRPPRSHRRALPEAVIAVAQARLERLEPSARKLLRAASVFGDNFWLDGVSALVGDDPVTLEPMIAKLVEEEILTPSEHPRFAGVRELGFRHALLRGTAYATLTEEDRALGHRLAAEWLVRVEEEAEVVAIHWLEGGDHARAASTFSRAGEARLSHAQADAAARCAARALLVGDPSTETADAITNRIDLLARSIEANRNIDVRDVLAGLERHLASFPAGSFAGSHEVVHAALERPLDALRSANASVLPDALVRAARALGALVDFAGAKRLLAEATARAKDDDLRVREARYASAKVAFWAGEMGTTVELLVETLLPEDPRERFEMVLLLAVAVVSLDGRPALARGLDFVGRAEALLGSHEEQERSPGESAEDPVARVHCAKARYFCFVLAGEYAKAADAAEVAIAIARQAGLRFEECAHLHNAGEQYVRLDDGDRARARLVESNDIAREIGSERNQKHNDVLLAYLDHDPDRIAGIADAARDANDRWLELYARYWLGHLLASTGASGALPALERAILLAGELKVRTMADDCARAVAGLAPAS